MCEFFLGLPPVAAWGGERIWGHPKPRQGLPPLDPAWKNLHIGLFICNVSSRYDFEAGAC